MKKLCLLLLLSHVAWTTVPPGNWKLDSNNLPVYQYTGQLPYKTPGYVNDSYKQSDDPYFILGNHRLTVFQHVSGNYEILTGERTWGTVNKGKDGAYVNTPSYLSVNGVTHQLTGNHSLALRQSTKKEFGCGYSTFQYVLDGISCDRIISVRPSEKVGTGTPALLINIRISNNNNRSVRIGYHENIPASYKMIGGSPAVKYFCRTETNEVKDIVKTNFTLHSTDPYLVPSKDEPSYYDANPPVLYLKNHPASDAKGIVSYSEVDSVTHELSVKYSFNLSAHEKKDMFFVVGFEYGIDFENITAIFSDIKKLGSENAFFHNEWRNKIPAFANETNEVLKRELQWNAYVLQAMATYVSMYGETYIPQGMDYDYYFGGSAAFRDHAQAGLSLCYIDKELAKSALRLCMKKITYSGEIRYTDKGYGSTTNYMWNTSDQQLYFFLFLSEYLRITKDYSILSEETEWYPMVFGKKATTIEKIQQAFFYLRDEISLGTHDLIKIMNSDWNDEIFHYYPINTYYWTASSHFNSAMAAVVLENLILQLQAGLDKNSYLNTNQWTPLVKSIGLYREKVKTALDKEIENREFSPRGYLTSDLIFGKNNMYLEPQPWLLMRSDLSKEKKQKLYAQVKNTLLSNEVLGARQLQKAEVRENSSNYLLPGVAENGGFWFSLNSPLILGVNTFDKDEAKALLLKMTFHNFEKNYPDYWVGQWSNEDCVNSSISQYPGLSRNGVYVKYPIFCSHPHAWPIYCYFKLLE